VAFPNDDNDDDDDDDDDDVITVVVLFEFDECKIFETPTAFSLSEEDLGSSVVEMSGGGGGGGTVAAGAAEAGGVGVARQFKHTQAAENAE
jgi:hypothetical protein